MSFESLYTNTVIVTPYRGAGRPQGCFVMERTMDAIAEALGKDRAEVRATNFIQPDEFPFDQGLIFQDGRQLEYDSGDYPASLEKIKELVGWDEFPAFKAEMAAQGRQVGIGLACYVEGTGVGPYEGAHVHIETSGKVKVATGLTTQGQGHATVFAQIAADVLGVPLEDVEVVTGDTRRMPYAVGTFASRAAVMSGSAIHLAATRAREKVLRIAADALEASEDDLEIVDGVVSVKGAPTSSIALGTIAVLSNPLRYAFDEQSKLATQFSVGDPGKPPVAEDDEPGLEGKDFYSPERSTFASGMHAVIVETDPLTAEITILKYAVVHDCGYLINPMIVEGQIHGGVAQGVGGALYERMAYDESGQLLNASFMDFLMPYVTEVPTSIEIDHLETPSPLNPLGIKGAGEAGVIPSAAVFAAAISDAEGFPITAMPISPSELYALRQARLEELMRIAGENVLHAPVERAWDALLDPAVLVATIPGCERLVATGENSYDMTVTAGVAAIKGTYAGTCVLSDLSEPASLVMKLDGAGAPGTIGATVNVGFADGGDGTTRVTWDADAVVGGMIGGVGQRMLTSVSKRMAGEFFGNVDKALSGTLPAAPVGVVSGRRARGRPGLHRPPVLGVSPRRRTSSRASPSAPASSSSGSSPARCSGGGGERGCDPRLNRGSRQLPRSHTPWKRSDCLGSRPDDRPDHDSTAREMLAALSSREISCSELMDLHLDPHRRAEPRAERDRQPRRGARP